MIGSKAVSTAGRTVAEKRPKIEGLGNRNPQQVALVKILIIYYWDSRRILLYATLVSIKMKLMEEKMNAEDKKAVMREMQQHTKGASVITVSQFGRFLGVDRSTARRKLAGLPRFENKFYLISDVADLWIRELKG